MARSEVKMARSEVKTARSEVKAVILEKTSRRAWAISQEMSINAARIDEGVSRNVQM